MSLSFDSSHAGMASRFLRPADVARLRRNQRRVAAQRMLVILRNTAVIAALAGGAIWVWRHTQSDARFAVTTIQLDGVVHTPRAALDLPREGKLLLHKIEEEVWFRWLLDYLPQ